MHTIALRRKRRRGTDELAPPEGDEKGPEDVFPRPPFWPVDVSTVEDNRTLLWEVHPLTWDEFPFRPSVWGCTQRLQWDTEMPQDTLQVLSYTRADFWNLLPWVGRQLIWGQGLASGIDVRQDYPPFYHECTLARDFITHWPVNGPDASVVGRCAVMVPMLCAYCWGHTWRRCDSIPRVGAYINTDEARLSPVLDECDHCGLTSDHNIAHRATAGDFGAVLAIVSRGASTVYDVLRCIAGCDVSERFTILSNNAGVAALQTLLSGVRIPLHDALAASAPMLVHTAGIASIILEYWQGVDMTSAVDLTSARGVNEAGGLVAAVRATRRCTHSFPCANGTTDAKCHWMDAWAHEWVTEAFMANPRTNEWIAEHAAVWFPHQAPENFAAGGDPMQGATWSPDSWSAWGVFRAHECPASQDGDMEFEEGDEQDEFEPGEFGL